MIVLLPLLRVEFATRHQCIGTGTEFDHVTTTLYCLLLVLVLLLLSLRLEFAAQHQCVGTGTGYYNSVLLLLLVLVLLQGSVATDMW